MSKKIEGGDYSAILLLGVKKITHNGEINLLEGIKNA